MRSPGKSECVRTGVLPPKPSMLELKVSNINHPSLSIISDSVTPYQFQLLSNGEIANSSRIKPFTVIGRGVLVGSMTNGSAVGRAGGVSEGDRLEDV